MIDRPDIYTPVQVETALTVFEFLMDRANDKPWASMFEDLGWAQMRLNAIDTAMWIDRVTKGLEFTVAYDWEVVPFLLLQTDLDWNLWGELAFGKLDVFPAVDAARAALLARFPSTVVEA